MSKDFYELLEVSSQATKQEIKKSYRQLARKFHPDNSDTGDEDVFKQIQEAYSVLSDDQKRGIYDQVGHDAFVNKVGQASGHGNPYASNDLFEEIFSQFFGGGGMGGYGRQQRPSGPQPRHGSDLQQQLEIDFLDACYGLETEVTIKRHIVCNECDGSGADKNHKPETCPTCHGHGEVQQQTQSFLGVITQVTTCPTCQGTGEIIKEKCKKCKGKKFIADEEKLEVKVPAGVEDGMRLVLHGKGNEGLNGGQDGDYYLLITVKEHEYFQRDGLDIVTELELSMEQAILGARIKIQTIHGEKFVNILPSTQSHTVHTLEDEGIKLKDGRRGNHYVRILVNIPHKKDLPDTLVSELDKLSNEENQENNTKKKKKKGFFFN